MKFRVKDCYISISFAFCIAISLYSVLNHFACMGVFAIAVHEIGHLLMMKKLHSFPSKINIGLLNVGIADKSYNERRLCDSILIFVAGSVVNIIFFIIFGLLYYFFEIQYFEVFAFINLGIGLFNLFPIDGLDGGSILYSIISKKKDDYAAQKILTVCSFVFLCPPVIVGFFILTQTKQNFSLILLSGLLIWGLFVKCKK